MSWDIGSVVSSSTFSVASEEGCPRGVFFSDDGTKMYMTGTFEGKLHEYRITEPWDILSAAYVRTLIISANVVEPCGLSFKSDGTKMYLLDSNGVAGNDVVEYDLGTAWDISTATHLQEYVIIESDDVEGIYMKPDGSKMYIVDAVVDRILEYNLGTNWDVSTAVYSQLFSVASQDVSPSDIYIKPDGSKMYVLGDAGNDVNEYHLVVPWDITTASYIQNRSAGDVGPHAIFFSEDGGKMYILGCERATVLEYTISTSKIRSVQSA